MSFVFLLLICIVSQTALASNSFTVVSGECNGIPGTLNPSTQVIDDVYTCRADTCDNLSGYTNTINGVQCPASVTRCWDQATMTFTSTGSCGTCIFTLGTPCTTQQSFSLDTFDMSDTSVQSVVPSLSSSLSIKITLLINLNIAATVSLPCNCRQCTNQITDTVPISLAVPIPITKSPLSILAAVLKSIPNPYTEVAGWTITLAQWTYLAYQYRQPIEFLFAAESNIYSCYSNLLASITSTTCDHIDLPDPTPCFVTAIQAFQIFGTSSSSHLASLSSLTSPNLSDEENGTITSPSIVYLSTGNYCPIDNHTISSSGGEYITGFTHINSTNYPILANETQFCFRDINDLSNQSYSFSSYESYVSPNPSNGSSNSSSSSSGSRSGSSSSNYNSTPGIVVRAVLVVIVFVTDFYN